MADENKDQRTWLVVWHPDPGLHMITADLTKRLRLATSSDSSAKDKAAAETLCELYENARLEILESLFCNMFQITKVEEEFVTVAVVDLLPPILHWPDGADGNKRPRTRPSVAGATGATGSSDITEEELQSAASEWMEEGGTEESLATVWTKAKWQVHCKAMGQRAQTIDNDLRNAKCLPPTPSVCPRNLEPRSRLQRWCLNPLCMLLRS